jgi:DNA-binding CsgD family transcriptional regulator/PAS domain-containing protein
MAEDHVVAPAGRAPGPAPAQAAAPAPSVSGEVVRAISGHLEPAMARCDFAIVVWDPSSGTILLANRAAAQVLGVELSTLIGRPKFELLTPRASVERAAEDLATGVIDSFHARWERSGRTISTWTRGIELDGRRVALSLAVPEDELERLGRHPTRRWPELALTVVGVIDRRWRVHSVSAEIEDLTGEPASAWSGRSLLAIVHPDDRSRLTGPSGGPPVEPASRCGVRLRHAGGGWTGACWLFAPLAASSASVAFSIVVPNLHDARADAGNRVDALERHLRRIGAEVRAAGVLDGLTATPVEALHPTLNELSTRQWQIVNLLLRGERVPAIARALYLSQSTVRNHLTTIFRRFGVHSQSELLQVLTRPPHEPAGHDASHS